MKKRLASSFVYTLLASGLFFAFNFTLAKVLGADVYGQIVYYISFINIVVLVISMNYVGLYMGNKISRNDLYTFSLFFTVESILFALVALPAYFVLMHYVQDTQVAVMILLIAYLLVIAAMVGLEYNSVKNVPRSILVSSLIPRVILIVIFTLFILLGIATPVHYLYAFAIANLAVVAFAIYKFKPRFYLKQELFSRAWKFYLLGIIGESFGYISQILQKEYGSYSQLATLSIVLLFFTGLGLVGSILVKFVLPKMHEYFRDNNIEQIGELYANNTLLVMLSAVPILTFLLIHIDQIALLLGDGYSMMPTMFYILVVGYGVDMITGITGYILRTTENEHYEIFNEIARLVFGLTLIYVLRNHPYGIAIAISASMLLYNILKYSEVYYLFRFVPIKLKQFIVIILFIFVSAFLMYLTRFIDTVWVKLLSNGIILLLLYALIYTYVLRNKYLLKGYKSE